MMNDFALTKSLVDGLAEVIQVFQESHRQRKPAQSTRCLDWFLSLDAKRQRNVLTSEEQNWLNLIATVAADCHRTPKGDGNLYSIDLSPPEVNEPLPPLQKALRKRRESGAALCVGRVP